MHNDRPRPDDCWLLLFVGSSKTMATEQEARLTSSPSSAWFPACCIAPFNICQASSMLLQEAAAPDKQTYTGSNDAAICLQVNAAGRGRCRRVTSHLPHRTPDSCHKEEGASLSQRLWVLLGAKP